MLLVSTGCQRECCNLRLVGYVILVLSFILGTPLLPSTIGTTTTTSTSTPSSSTISTTTSISAVPSNTPVVSVSPTPGDGATEMLAQWTLLLSLLLVTMISVMMI